MAICRRKVARATGTGSSWVMGSRSSSLIRSKVWICASSRLPSARRSPARALSSLVGAASTALDRARLIWVSFMVTPAG